MPTAKELELKNGDALFITRARDEEVVKIVKAYHDGTPYLGVTDRERVRIARDYLSPVMVIATNIPDPFLIANNCFYEQEINLYPDIVKNLVSDRVNVGTLVINLQDDPDCYITKGNLRILKSNLSDSLKKGGIRHIHEDYSLFIPISWYNACVDSKDVAKPKK